MPTQTPGGGISDMPMPAAHRKAAISASGFRFLRNDAPGEVAGLIRAEKRQLVAARQST